MAEEKEKPTRKELASKGLSKVKGAGSGFIAFIKEQNVVSLAIGLVLGTAASGLVNSLINNIIMPPLGFLLFSADVIRGLEFVLGVTPAGEVAILHYGQFINDLINFLVLAFVVYFVVKLLKLDIKK